MTPSCQVSTQSLTLPVRFEATKDEFQWLEVVQRDAIGPSGLLLSNDNLLGVSSRSLALPRDAKSRFDAKVASLR